MTEATKHRELAAAAKQRAATSICGQKVGCMPFALLLWRRLLSAAEIGRRLGTEARNG